MEGPLEIKDSAIGAEEPIKSEAPVQNPDSSDRSDGAVSPPPNCSICLGKLVNTSFTDSCLHQFCFTCLLQWSKIKTECPLCKQTFKSIIHNVRSEEDYDQYHIPRELATMDLNFELGHTMDVGTHRFHYRTTMTGHHRRSHEIVLNPEQVARREQLPSIAPQVPMGERLRRRANSADYRRTIYRLGIWATALPDVFGRFRECSADFYRREPRELNRLIPWLNRELQVLLNNNAPHVAYVLGVILDALSQYDIRSAEFRNIIRAHFGTLTDHFVHELLNYARTNFDLVGYDQSVTYLPQGLSNEYVSNVLSPASSSSSTSSDDSDVRVLDEAIDLRMNTEMPSAQDVLDELDQMRGAVDNISLSIVGKTRVLLEGDSKVCRRGECNLGNLITDAMIDYNAGEYANENSWTDAAMAFQHGGGIRNSITKANEDKVTMGDVLSVLPFQNTIVKVSMTGEMILSVLEWSVYSLNVDLSGAFLQFSGLQVVYDLSRPKNSRVVSVEVLCSFCNVPIYSKLQNNQTYNVLLPDFMQNGGDGYSMLKDLKTHSLGVATTDTLVEYLKKHSPVHPAVEWRITYLRDQTENNAPNGIYRSIELAILLPIISWFLTR